MQNTGRANTSKKEKANKTIGQYYGAEKGKERPQTEIRKHIEELRTFNKMSVSNSHQESVSSSSSEEGEI